MGMLVTWEHQGVCHSGRHNRVPEPRDSNNRDSLFHSSGDLKFKIKVSAGPVPSEGGGRPVPGLSVCVAVSTWPSLHACLSVPIFPSYTDPSHT